MASVTGWIALAAVFIAGLVSILARLRLGKRAAPSSRPISAHVVLGTVTTMLASGHTFVVLPELGSSTAIAGGMLALAPGALAFFVLFAHVGLGLQLRKEKLKDRAKKRRAHLATALTIAIAAVVHAVLLLRVS
jgi:4-amino-4-deoxy-L-arabinose transferase-like glycosyltransferase